MPAKINGTICGGTPACKASRSILCSTMRCSNLSVSCRAFSSSCFLRSSSALACSHKCIDGSLSAECHCEDGGGGGSCGGVCVAVSGGGGKVLDGGGGKLLREDESIAEEDGVVFVVVAVFGDEGSEG